MATNDGPQQANSYIFDAESALEMSRLLDLDKIVTMTMGGILAEYTPQEINKFQHVLDIGCGPGGWVHEMAFMYPDKEITGIDISENMIRYAQAHAQVRGLHNAHFQVLDALDMHMLPDSTFDLVNIRLAVGFVPNQHWLDLLTECERVLRPGGMLRQTEIEVGFTNKPALETILAISQDALHRVGRGFSPTGRHTGMTYMLRYLFQQAGFQQISTRAYGMDFSFGTVAHTAVFSDYKFVLLLAKPLIAHTGILPEPEYDALYAQAMSEMQQPDFCGMSFLFTAWGYKPI